MNSITLRRQFSCIRGAKSCSLCVSANWAEAELRMGVLCAHCTVPQYLTEGGSRLQHSDEHTATLFNSGDWLSLERGVASAELYVVTVLQYGQAISLMCTLAGRFDFQTPSTLHGVYFIGLMITTEVKLNRCGAPTEWIKNHYCSASAS